MTIRAFVASLAALAVTAQGGAFDFPGLMPPSLSRSERPHPAIARLRDYQAVLHTNLGKIAIELDADSAPNAVRNFIKLAQRGFYDGTRFYCVFKGRMVLAGDPTGKGTGDAGYTLDYENSPVGHTAGTVAMDRSGEAGKNSGSRFFISVGSQHHLDRDYTVFGRVADGLEVARRISSAPARPQGGRPTPIEEIVIEQITVSKRAEKPGQSGKEGVGQE